MYFGSGGGARRLKIQQMRAGCNDFARDSFQMG